MSKRIVKKGKIVKPPEPESVVKSYKINLEEKKKLAKELTERYLNPARLEKYLGQELAETLMSSAKDVLDYLGIDFSNKKGGKK